MTVTILLLRMNRRTLTITGRLRRTATKKMIFLVLLRIDTRTISTLNRRNSLRVNKSNINFIGLVIKGRFLLTHLRRDRKVSHSLEVGYTEVFRCDVTV